MTQMSIAWELALAAVRAQMQYRASFLLQVCAGIVFQCTGLVFLWAVLSRFGMIDGWTLAQMGVLYGMRLTAHGLFQVALGGMFRMDDIVISGEFDRYLLRPLHPVVQLMCMALRITTLGDLIGGVGVLALALPKADIHWTAGTVALLIVSVIGGGMLEAAIQFIPVGLAFRFFDSWSINRVLDDLTSNVANYPLTIFDRLVRYALTFVLPLGFIAWIPAAALLHKHTGFPHWFSWLLPVIGAVLLWLGIRFFEAQARHYQSSGS